LDRHCICFSFLMVLINLYFNYRLHALNITTHPYPPIWYVTIFFQVLNEEIVYRGILFKTVSRKLNPTISALLIAAVFLLIHLFFYYYGENLKLSGIAITVLFLFSVLCNMLYLMAGHIWHGFILE
jgi:membrane protease YdiL (CAAX protease family)